VVTGTSAALGYLCAAISYESALARAPLVSTPPPPSELAKLTDPNGPQQFFDGNNPVCQEWDALLNQFSADSAAWQALDASIPASAWTSEQRAVVDATIPLMMRYADDLERLGRNSSNPTFEDFAVLSAQYRRAYAEALPTYSAADSYLSRTAAMTASTIYEACKAVGG